VGVRPKESTLSCGGWSNLREFKEVKEAVALVFIGPVMASFVYLPVCWPLIASFHCVLQGFIYLFIFQLVGCSLVSFHCPLQGLTEGKESCTTWKLTLMVRRCANIMNLTIAINLLYA
jgi:hypothetical protein